MWKNVPFKHRFSTLSPESEHNILQDTLGAMVSSEKGKRDKVSDTCGTQINAGNAAHAVSDSRSAAVLINLAGAAQNAIFNEEGLHLSWFAQFTSIYPPVISPQDSQQDSLLCWIYFMWFWSPGVTSVRRGH